MYELWRGIQIIWVNLRDPLYQVITDLVLKLISKLIWGSGSAMKEDGCKEGAKCLSAYQQPPSNIESTLDHHARGLVLCKHVWKWDRGHHQQCANPQKKWHP